LKPRSLALIAAVVAAGSVHAHETYARQPYAWPRFDDLVYGGPAIPAVEHPGYVRIPELDGPVGSPWYLGRQPARQPEPRVDREDGIIYCAAIGCRPGEPGYGEPNYGTTPIME